MESTNRPTAAAIMAAVNAEFLLPHGRAAAAIRVASTAQAVNPDYTTTVTECLRSGAAFARAADALRRTDPEASQECAEAAIMAAQDAVRWADRS